MESKIKEGELRLGLWVNVPRADQSPFRIDLIEYCTNGFAKVGMNVHKYENPFKEGELINGHPLTWELNDLTPIELSEQVLLNIKQFESNNIRIDAVIDLRWRHDKIWLVMGAEVQDLDISYLYQLQNLCSSLGKELEFKA